jgi:hypothetical protein
MCKLRLIKLHACFAHPSIDRSTLDVIAFGPDPGVGNASALGPRPAWELAENAFLDKFWGQIGRHINGMCEQKDHKKVEKRKQITRGCGSGRVRSGVNVYIKAPPNSIGAEVL